MNTDMQRDSFERLLQQNPGEIQQWLDDTLPQVREISDGINLLGLAEAARLGAVENSDVKLAQVSNRIYEYLSETASAKRKDDYMLSAMLLRVAMILKLGANHDNPILNPQTIIDWGLSISETPQQIASMAQAWKQKIKRETLSEVDIAQLRKLRKIKQKMYPVKLLVEHESIEADGEIKSWLSLYYQLP